MRFMRSFRGLPFACLLGVVLFAAPLSLARADELQDVSKMVANGKLDDAEKRADVFLAKNPKDAQMRFLKGVILTQRGKRDDAIVVYTGITQDYPELPEPYNNLAVIHAAQGAYDKAREALETALRITPDYATAYENLGDVYAALAAQSYQNAQRLDTRNSGALRKLNATRLLLGASGAPAPASSTSASAGSTPAGSASPGSASTMPASAPVRSQRNVGLPSPAGAAVAGVGATAPDVVIPANATAVPSGSNIVAIENAPNADQTTPVADVSGAVKRWAAPRLVQVDDLRIRVDGDTAVARFRETANSPRRVVNRLLNLKQSAGDWTVTGERIEP